MNNLTTSTKWALLSFAAGAATIINTFLIEGDLQIVIYVLIGLSFAAFAVINSQNDEKAKNDDA